VIPPDHIQGCAAVAKEFGLAVHLDGARIFNAAVALAVDAREITRHVDTVSFCLSKGLSAPVGSLLTGPKAFIDRARMVRRAYGGTLRQAGIIAAPGIIALKSMIGRLAEDHANARAFAEAVAEMEGLHVDLGTVQSNIVNLDVGGLGIDAATFAAHLDGRGVRGLPGMDAVIRFVTYRNVSGEDTRRAIKTIGALVEERPWRAE
jgi:threonine aldolase